MLARVPVALNDGGFGADMRDALVKRADHLAAEGLASRQGPRTLFARDPLKTLRRREIDAASAKLSAETGLPRQSAAEGEHVTGIYRRRLQLASGRFAMIDNGLGFELVPWKPALEKYVVGRSRAWFTRAARWLGASAGRADWGSDSHHITHRELARCRL